MSNFNYKHNKIITTNIVTYIKNTFFRECLTIIKLHIINYLFSYFSLNVYIYIIYTLCTIKKDCNCLVTVSKQFFLLVVRILFNKCAILIIN